MGGMPTVTAKSDSGVSRSRSNSQGSSQAPGACPFRLGQVINVRNTNDQQWMLASVQQINPTCLVTLLGPHARKNLLQFAQMAPARTKTFYAKKELVIYERPKN